MERFAIVGTAGHIDHGKTALVEALTGKNTDRLKEERERGISIDIDFAPLYFPDGVGIGVVDVPGHERFVRNMVAGAAGVDLALLVIDIREGVMPQTREHVAILQMLGVRQGVVALSKADLADAEWLEVAPGLIREELSGTVFAEAPMIRTSVRTGEGVDRLRQVLHDLAADLPGRDAAGAFRLPVDKVFVIPGHGTVVSGTVWRGTVQQGEVLELLPGRRTVRVRAVQVHGRPVSRAVAGQRAALNLTGVDRAEVTRGHTLAAQGTLVSSKLLDVSIEVLADYERGLRHRDRVHVHLGTAEAVGRALLLDGDEVPNGGRTLAQLLLDRPLVAETGDAFVLRSYSPVVTLGGGRVLDPAPDRLHRRKRAHILEMLRARADATPRDRLLALGRDGRLLTPRTASAALGVTEAEAAEILDGLRREGRLVQLPGGSLVSEAVEDALTALERRLQEIHRKHRFADWVPKGEVLTAGAAGILGPLGPRDLDWLIQEGVRRGRWETDGPGIRRAGHRVVLTPEEEDIRLQLLSALEAAGLAGSSEADLVRRFPKRDRVAAQLLRYVQARGDAVELEPGLWIGGRVLADAEARLRALYREQGPFAIGQARDALGCGRRMALAILEFLDKRGRTRREGDTRVFLAES
ncbi:selenocysteine-specific translation elongation factor [Alicyclobacillus sp.]|uniref:selenocysteine-specific translation elongation factor n=1 Tax=Alicyclobacillus sp. TaxID=61169 RepID=UPI0025BB11FE|nr:selenocysteine-specific translation elongation factor [Alicyclobacillus sp.]MCL6516831.1 selenocysteine-specific translation elongation factor [Alicyclobacillus sp.]